jgi:hypothetical protein
MSRHVGTTGYFFVRENVLTSFRITNYCSVLSGDGLNNVNWIHVAQDRGQ